MGILYKIDDVEKLLGVSRTTLLRWERKGWVPKGQRLRRYKTRIYTEKDIDAIAACRDGLVLEDGSILNGELYVGNDKLLNQTKNSEDKSLFSVKPYNRETVFDDLELVLTVEQQNYKDVIDPEDALTVQEFLYYHCDDKGVPIRKQEV